MKLPHPVEEPDEFRAWSLLYLERHLSEAEERSFTELLARSPEARRAFAEAAQFDAELYEIRNQETLVEPKAPFRRRPSPERRTAWVPALIAAGVLAAIVLGAVLPRPELKPLAREARPDPKIAKNVEPPPVPVIPPAPKDPLPEPKPAPAPVSPAPETPPEPPKAPPSEPRPEEKKRPPAPAPAPARVPERTTRALARAGRLEQIQGQVFVLAGKSRIDAAAGQDLLPGQGLQTSRESAVTLLFADGTRLELASETLLRDVLEAPSKQAQLAHGTLSADVAKQPAGQPMRLSTPSAELTIMGTKFVVTADSKATRLQVKEGQVRFARKRDGATLDVSGGNSAAAGDGLDFALRSVRPPLALKGRTSADIEAIYLFTEGKGAIVEDLSGVGDPLDLRVREEAAVRWLPTGLLVRAPTAIVSAGPATKIIDSCKKSHEITVEAWINPANAAQLGPARIVSMAASSSARGFFLGQGEDKGANPLRFTMRLRTTSNNESGMPAMMSDEGAVKVGLTHLVATRSRSGAARLYVDGAERGRLTIGGDFGRWNKDARLALAEDPQGEGSPSWLGAYYLVAIYSRALSTDEILQHFKAGPTPRAK